MQKVQRKALLLKSTLLMLQITLRARLQLTQRKQKKKLSNMDGILNKIKLQLSFTAEEETRDQLKKIKTALATEIKKWKEAAENRLASSNLPLAALVPMAFSNAQSPSNLTIVTNLQTNLYEDVVGITSRDYGSRAQHIRAHIHRSTGRKWQRAVSDMLICKIGGACMLQFVFRYAT
jgi:hypothetical protein